jgi:hypothetical protein
MQPNAMMTFRNLFYPLLDDGNKRLYTRLIVAAEGNCKILSGSDCVNALQDDKLSSYSPVD